MLQSRVNSTSYTMMHAATFANMMCSGIKAVWHFVLVCASLHMGERAAKLRRLDEFRRSLPHCSASALTAICG